MFVEEADRHGGARWRMMEEVMKKLYSDNVHLLEEIWNSESTEERGYEEFIVPSTGYVKTF
jgi:hypothetical protein